MFLWRFMGIGMDCLTSMLILTPVILILLKIQGRKLRSWHTFALWLYICALAGICSVTGLPNLRYCRLEFSFNLIPMVDVFSSPMQYLLNVIMFLPVGFFLPLLFQKYQGTKQVLGFAGFLTIYIEVLQIFTFRTTDIDDLLTNLLGAWLGYLLVRTVTKWFRIPLPLGEGEKEETCGQWLYLAAVALEQFFIQPYWSAFFWDVLIG